jgi:hypothetical protein
MTFNGQRAAEAESRVRRVLRDPRVLPAQKAHRVYKALKDRKALRGLRGLKETPEPRGIPGPTERTVRASR